jgi:diacylglycerol kinase (ATP)
MEPNNFNFRDRIKSFSYAFNGIKILFKVEHNARIHLFATVLVCLSGFIFKISKLEWIVITIVIGLVFMMEIVNSSIERISNFISPARNEEIKIIKDLAAAAVLIMAIVSVIVGLIIFLPKIILVVN